MKDGLRVIPTKTQTQRGDFCAAMKTALQTVDVELPAPLFRLWDGLR